MYSLISGSPSITVDSSTRVKTMKHYTNSLKFFPVIILLVIFFTRIHQLASYPPFLDEALHIQFARSVHDFRIFPDASSGKIFALWWMAAFWPFGAGSLWIVRAGGAIFSLITAAGIYALSIRLTSKSTGIFVLILYGLSPYIFFYERLALVDTYVAAFGIIGALFAVRLSQRGRAADAILAGLALAMAMLAKANGIMLWVIPILAILMLQSTLSLRKRICSAALVYGLLILIWVPFYLFLVSRGYNYFGTATSLAGTTDTTGIVGRLLNNLIGVWQIDVNYMSMPFMLVLLALSLYTLVQYPRPTLPLMLMVILPLAAQLAFATKLSGRYMQFHFPLLMVLLSVGLDRVSRDLNINAKRLVLVVTMSAVLLWAVAIPIPFMLTAWSNPANLPLTSLDRLEYVTSDAAGFSLPEVTNYLIEHASITNRKIHIVGILANCFGLQLLAEQLSGRHLTIECPYVTQDRSQQRTIAARIDQLALESENSNFELWVAVENIPYANMDYVESSFVQEVIYHRPDGLTEIALLRHRKD